MNGFIRRASVLAVLMAANVAQVSAAAETSRQQRPVAGVERVLWEAVGELRITQAHSEKLVIEAEPRLLAKIKAQVSDQTLALGFTEPQISTSAPIRFHLTVKTLREIESVSSGMFSIERLVTPNLRLKLGGSSEMVIGSLTAARLDVQIPGSSNVVIRGGVVEEQVVDITGSADYRADGLESRTSSVSLSGSGDVTVHATKRLLARLSGAGEILYIGNPEVDQVVDGAGQVGALVRR